eukprot:TRINITY_DN15056_c1_g1_i3.p1 TRINITY_DN15056_c1_g1~~TRINITY_DN15056_c1_g1_i3.p1  ORF type:complete len:218 (-),score=-1.94 TRINITY_DN15056_c1_g1_i3:128-781(-)
MNNQKKHLIHQILCVPFQATKQHVKYTDCLRIGLDQQSKCESLNISKLFFLICAQFFFQFMQHLCNYFHFFLIYATYFSIELMQTIAKNFFKSRKKDVAISVQLFTRKPKKIPVQGPLTNSSYFAKFIYQNMDKQIHFLSLQYNHFSKTFSTQNCHCQYFQNKLVRKNVFELVKKQSKKLASKKYSKNCNKQPKKTNEVIQNGSFLKGSLFQKKKKL